MKPIPLLLGGFALLAILTLGVAAGPVWIGPSQWGDASGTTALVLWEIRLPRMLAAFAIGGCLALAGAWFQVLLGNPLAEPFVLGTAGGGAFGAVFTLGFFPALPGGVWIGAFLGAWAGTLAIFLFARHSRERMLLAGVVLAAFWGALTTLVLAVLPEGRLGPAMHWLMGSLAQSDMPTASLLAAWGGALVLGLLLARTLDLLLLGEATAQSLGVPVHLVRQGLVAAASLITAVAVAACGPIGFVGLVVPHAVRLVVGAGHLRLLPLTALAGGGFLVAADTAARTLLAPAELPVSAVTALIGVPVFLWLLARKGGVE